MEQPIKYWVPSIAPSGMTFYNGDLFPEWKGNLFVSALVPGDVRRITLVGNKAVDEEILFNKEERVQPKVAERLSELEAEHDLANMSPAELTGVIEEIGYKIPKTPGETKEQIYEKLVDFLEEEILLNTVGRIRNVVSAPDGSLVLATDSPKGKLIRVVPNN